MKVVSSKNNVTQGYPLIVETKKGKALLEVKGGLAYVPIVFSGLRSVENPKLWEYVGRDWKLVDQSVRGKDFWQVDVNSDNGTFDLIYNLNRDFENEKFCVNYYFLGDKCPTKKPY